MDRSSDVSAALATLQARWGAAAPRRGGEAGPVVEGALARAPMPLEAPPEADPRPAPGLAPSPLAPVVRPRPGAAAPDADGRIVSTGFAALDAILGPGGLPRAATVALRGDASSGQTTGAPRVAAEAQAGGAIVAWLDLARAFDPVEAVARGLRPEWLVVLTPADLAEALALAAALLSARTVDLLVVDLPDGRDSAVAGARVGDRLGRLAALARRAGTLLVILEPRAHGRGLAAAVAEASGLRLELDRGVDPGRTEAGSRATVAATATPGQVGARTSNPARGAAATVPRDELLWAAGLRRRRPRPRRATRHRAEGPPSTDRHASAPPLAAPSLRLARCLSHGSEHLRSWPPGWIARGQLDGRDRGEWFARALACAGGSRSGPPTGSRPRRPSSTSRLTRTGTSSRPPASGWPCSAPGSPAPATSPIRRSAGSPSTRMG
jgi:hypothetical protein